jgi:hypothetical protein
MNIFKLDDCPQRSAELQHDKHVVKMILESAQLLCGAYDTEDTPPYKRTQPPLLNMDKDKQREL